MYKSSKIATLRSRRFKSLISVMLVAAILITGALAYLTATDSKTNTFTVGNVSLILQEPEWDEKNGENITPGETVAKDPEIVNNGTVDAYVYLSVSVPKGEYTFVDEVTGATIEGVNTKLFEYDYNDTNWKEFAYVEGETEDVIYYYYDGILPAGETTEALFEDVSLIDLVSGSGAEGQELNIIINGFGIQSNFDDSEIDTPQEAWNALVNQSGNTNLPTVATTVELNFVNALGETAQTTIFELEDAATTEITVPEVVAGGYNAYVTTYGAEYEPNTTIMGSDIIIPAETDSEKAVITATQSTSMTTIQGDGVGEVVKLVPVEGTSVVIDRNGITETYYNNENTVTDTYTYTDTDFSNYYIYGLNQRNCTPAKINTQFVVKGNGYAVIYPYRVIPGATNTAIGTGSIVEVYTANNELVEVFRVVYYGDFNGDARNNGADIAIINSAINRKSGYGMDFNNLNDYIPAMFKAADLNCNGQIDFEDEYLLCSAVARIRSINQSTGEVYEP